MEYKIALILKEHFRSKINSYLEHKPADVILDFYPYTTIKEIQDIFLSIKEEYDGFYVSGLIPLQAIKILGDAGREGSIAYSAVNVENVYRSLLRHMIVTGIDKVDLSRIGIDFLTGDSTVEELIRTDQFAQAAHTYEQYWSSLESVEELETEEMRVQEFYVKQCREHKLDVIITYYYSVIERVKEFGVECHYVYRGEWAFWNSIEELKKSIYIRKSDQHRNAVIHIDTEKARDLYKDTYEIFRLELTKLITQFNGQNLNQAIFKASYDDLELYMDYKTMEQLTNGFKICPLLPFLQQKIDFPGSIGYGIGNNIYQARLNAVNAANYGKGRTEKAQSSYLLDSGENLISLSAGNTVPSAAVLSISTETVAEIADRTKLSQGTIVRIAEVLNAGGTSRITSQDLIDRLGTSLRSANKFLSCLEKGGVATVCGQVRQTGKGRPINIYEIDFKQKKE